MLKRRDRKKVFVKSFPFAFKSERIKNIGYLADLAFGKTYDQRIANLDVFAKRLAIFSEEKRCCVVNLRNGSELCNDFKRYTLNLIICRVKTP